MTSFRVLVPTLVGTTVRDRAIACIGALIGISLTGLISGATLGQGAHLPLIVAPMGASAVLLFAIPASPLARPWSIVGGNTLSAIVGIAAARVIPDPMIASGVAVGLAIAVMSLTRSLHPPGGAAALTAVIGGPAVAGAGFAFAFMPVCLNAVVLTVLGIAVHRLTGRNYPHKPAPPPAASHGTADPPPQMRVGFRASDIDGAIADLGESLDIDRKDLDQLLLRVERRALERGYGALLCGEVMARDVVRVEPTATPEEARRLLDAHDVERLPVVDPRNRVVGIVGARELLRPGRRVADVMAKAITAAEDRPVLQLLDWLTDGRTHAVVIVDGDGHLVGMVTQTDLLAALAHLPPPERR